MHILYLHQYFTTPEIGGGTRSYEFAIRLKNKGHDIEFISGPFKNNHYGGKKIVEIDNMKVHIVGKNYSNKLAYGNRMLVFIIYAVKASLKGIKLKKPDIIYATSTPLTVAIPALFLSWYFKVPFVFEVRDVWPEAPIQMGALKNPFIIKAMKFLEKFTYHKAAHIVALSPGMKDEIIKTGVPENKISMIPNSSDLQLFDNVKIDKNVILQKYGLRCGNIILYAGTLGEANDVNYLVKAARKLHEFKKDIHIVVAGEGKNFNKLKQQIELYNLQNITLTGYLSKYEVAQLYKVSKASLVIFKNVPILMTNSPNKFFDSLAAGTPVISNMSGWIEGLIEKYNIGLYFKPDDVDKLVANMITIVSDDNLQSLMSENAKNLAKELFDRDKLAVELEKILVKSTGKNKEKCHEADV